MLGGRNSHLQTSHLQSRKKCVKKKKSKQIALPKSLLLRSSGPMCCCSPTGDWVQTDETSNSQCRQLKHIKIATDGIILPFDSVWAEKTVISAAHQVGIHSTKAAVVRWKRKSPSRLFLSVCNQAVQLLANCRRPKQQLQLETQGSSVLVRHGFHLLQRGSPHQSPHTWAQQPPCYHCSGPSFKRKVKKVCALKVLWSRLPALENSQLFHGPPAILDHHCRAVLEGVFLANGLPSPFSELLHTLFDPLALLYCPFLQKSM